MVGRKADGLCVWTLCQEPQTDELDMYCDKHAKRVDGNITRIKAQEPWVAVCIACGTRSEFRETRARVNLWLRSGLLRCGFCRALGIQIEELDLRDQPGKPGLRHGHVPSVKLVS